MFGEQMRKDQSRYMNAIYGEILEKDTGLGNQQTSRLRKKILNLFRDQCCEGSLE